MAVEASAAAEVRRVAHETKWKGRIFLPVLHAVGRAEGGGEGNLTSAIIMERADGTLKEKHLDGDALNCVAWALASTLAALNRAGFIHGDLKPENVLWKKMPTHADSVMDGWPLLTDFGASQNFQSFKPGEAVS
eukprot:207556-Amphidinium_carterae.1